jgi:hypothetical protein
MDFLETCNELRKFASQLRSLHISKSTYERERIAQIRREAAALEQLRNEYRFELEFGGLNAIFHVWARDLQKFSTVPPPLEHRPAIQANAPAL